MNQYKNKKILITGGSGFIGSALVKKLKSLDARVFAPASRQLDLLNPKAVKYFLCDIKPEVVFHLAAKVGGIGYTSSNNMNLFEDNVTMGINIITACECSKTRLVNASSACVYPETSPLPYLEGDVFNGLPARDMLLYAMAKRDVMLLNKGVNLVLTGVFGPGEKIGEGEHVTGAILRKLSQDQDVVFWGDGNQTRDFVFIDDAVNAFLLAGLYEGKHKTFNISGGYEISIRRLVYLIARKMKYKGNIFWDDTKPVGFKRRLLDTNLAKKELGWLPKISLNLGLEMLIKWYGNN